MEHFINLDTTESRTYLCEHGVKDLLTKCLNKTYGGNLLRKISEILSLENDQSVDIEIVIEVTSEEFLRKTLNFVAAIDHKYERTKVSKDILCILEKVYMKSPSLSLGTVGILVAINALLHKTINEVSVDNEESLLELHQLVEDIDNLKKGIINYSVQLQRSRERKDADNRQPPENFRQIPILPTTEDIFISGSGKPFLRKNIVRGSYSSLEHYLDVQFRLLREDCISPIRSGIMEYIEQKQLSGATNVGRLQDARLYRRTIIKGSEIGLEGRLHTIMLDPNHAKRIRWHTSNRLIYGTLVCLSPDDFKTLYFGVVMESNRKTLMEDHTFKVRITREEGVRPIPLRTHMVIIESSAYFEAYRHGLKCLQRIGDDDLPFERYIVHCKTNVGPPVYLQGKETPLFDFYSNIKGKTIHEMSSTDTEDNYKYHIMKKSWPTAEELQMDESQYSAFKAALVQEFTIIQGPPGTGKTFLGLQIAKALLRNKHLWNTCSEEICPASCYIGQQPQSEESDHRNRENVNSPCKEDEAGHTQNEKHKTHPMLVVCYTNHALDQFLEGIVAFSVKTYTTPNENKIVRVGNRCKNQWLEQFSLRRHRQKHEKYIPTEGYKRNIETKYHEIQTLRYRLQETKDTVISAQELYLSLGLSFPFGEAKKQYSMYDWLGVSKRHWMMLLRQHLLKSKDELANISDDDESTIHMEGNLIVENIDVETEDARAVNERKFELDEFEIKYVKKRPIGLSLGHQLNDILHTHSRKMSGSAKRFLWRTASENVKLLKVKTIMSLEKVSKLQKNPKRLWKLPKRERWDLYRFWLERRTVELQNELLFLESEFEDIFEEYEVAKKNIDEDILRNADVIAITTTGAARYQDLLHRVDPRIIIVEEAAEVLEAHIVSTLSPNCKQLILIGDHRQLEPKPAVYELARTYNMSISMFERMINNGMSFNCLSCQHRMRPDISQLVRPIYDKLIDHENVKNYPDVLGVQHNIFFLKHENLETFKDDGRSYSNEFEANFVMKFCHYLLQQGYSPNQITILTPYSGQMFAIRDIMPKENFNGIRISILDNFQGEENDIIILSLVRSNAEGKIGFLGKENRICVALSRAKHGLYVIGNIDQFCRHSKNNLWRKAVEYLTDSRVGITLPLYCVNHKEMKTLIKVPEDFNSIRDGGCAQPCEFRLKCGHACGLLCHSYDRQHRNYKCEKKCPITCENGHECEKKCHFPRPCECDVLMEKPLFCGHTEILRCSVDPFSEMMQRIIGPCKKPCGNICRNGHECEKPCHYPSDCKCGVRIDKELPCGHINNMVCHKDPLEYFCKENVMKVLPKCGHEVEMSCSDIPLLVKCQELVTKTLSCKHSVEIKCSTDIQEHKCQTQVWDELPCGHKIKRRCFRKGQFRKCKEKIIETREGCGHDYIRECWDKDFIKQNVCKERVSLKRSFCAHYFNAFCHKYETAIQHNSTEEYARKALEKEAEYCTVQIMHEWSCRHKPQPINCSEIQFARCSEKCGILCPNNHVCEEICHYPDNCKCMVNIPKLIPKCGHIQSVPCASGTSNFKCEALVEKTMTECGHPQMLPCHADIVLSKCMKLVVKKLECGHGKEMPCSMNTSEALCEFPVSRRLECGHDEVIKCCEIENLRKEQVCTKLVEIQHPRLRYKAQVPCSQKNHVMNMFKCDRYCRKVNWKNPCRPDFVDEIQVEWDCGHVEVISVNDPDKSECTAECKRKLSCGHFCTAECSSCCTGIFHVKCKKECERYVVCGHLCSSKNCGSCMLCERKCEHSCTHMTCDLTCFEPCRLCNEPCPWSCTHFKCSKSCGEVCDRPRCNAQCKNRLRCGHVCIGYCGEPCPDLCRICNSEELRKVSNNIEGKFVQLLDCNHLFEGNYFDGIIDQRENGFENIPCPACGTYITIHPRYTQTLNKIFKRREDAKLQLLFTAEKENAIAYPSLSKSVLRCRSYLKKIGNFLLIENHLYRSIDESAYIQMESLHDGVRNHLDIILKEKRPSIQQYLDLYKAVEKLSAYWQYGVAVCEVVSSVQGLSEDEEYYDDWLDDPALYCDSVVLAKIRDAGKRVLSHISKLSLPDSNAWVKINKEISEVESIAHKGGREHERNTSQVKDFPRMPFVTDPHLCFWNVCAKKHAYCSASEDGSCRLCSDSKFAKDFKIFTQKLLRKNTDKDGSKLPTNSVKQKGHGGLKEIKQDGQEEFLSLPSKAEKAEDKGAKPKQRKKGEKAVSKASKTSKGLLDAFTQLGTEESNQQYAKYKGKLTHDDNKDEKGEEKTKTYAGVLTQKTVMKDRLNSDSLPKKNTNVFRSNFLQDANTSVTETRAITYVDDITEKSKDIVKGKKDGRDPVLSFNKGEETYTEKREKKYEFYQRNTATKLSNAWATRTENIIGKIQEPKCEKMKDIASGDGESLREGRHKGFHAKEVDGYHRDGRIKDGKISKVQTSTVGESLRKDQPKGFHVKEVDGYHRDGRIKDGKIHDYQNTVPLNRSHDPILRSSILYQRKDSDIVIVGEPLSSNDDTWNGNRKGDVTTEKDICHVDETNRLQRSEQDDKFRFPLTIGNYGHFNKGRKSDKSNVNYTSRLDMFKSDWKVEDW